MTVYIVTNYYKMLRSGLAVPSLAVRCARQFSALRPAAVSARQFTNTNLYTKLTYSHVNSARIPGPRSLCRTFASSAPASGGAAPLTDRIKDDMKAAMKAKDTVCTVCPVKARTRTGSVWGGRGLRATWHSARMHRDDTVRTATHYTGNFLCNPCTHDLDRRPCLRRVTFPGDCTHVCHMPAAR